jgi:catechol 2,3-dioxygenase-like lactoylglutathione lyase family enzyme
VVIPRHEGVSPAARNPFGHIDLRVASMADALPFYEALLPALGFTQRYDSPEWKVFATIEPPPSSAYIAITQSVGHVSNENRIAFWAPDPGEVDRLASVVAAAGGRDVSGPKAMPYGPGYYAVYFADPGGNRFEVDHRPPV